MFLQYRLHGTQKEWENETCHKSEISKTLSPGKKPLQHGYIKQRSESNKIKRLDDYPRSLDAYLQVPIFKKIQTISKILHLMENILFRAHSCTHSFREITLDRL
jgi:hypothetical protein